jgi:hypothetical protein
MILPLGGASTLRRQAGSIPANVSHGRYAAKWPAGIRSCGHHSGALNDLAECVHRSSESGGNAPFPENFADEVVNSVGIDRIRGNRL